MPKVNPHIMEWARKRAALSLEDAARSIGLSGKNAVERLADIEAGRSEPTRRQIAEMSKAYRRPLLTFYLLEPPPPGERTHDFRTVSDPEPGPEGILDALVRDVRARQALILTALEDAEEAEPLPFVGSLPTIQAPAALAAAIRKTWDIDIEEFRRARNVDDAFRLLRDKVEASGVFVILMGNLGHYTSNLSPKVFRGFALADPVAPFVIINETDSRSAWSFTLLHELGHILIGQSGISGYDSEARVERLCDEAAAQVLLRQDEVKEVILSPSADLDQIVAAIGAFANSRKLSRKMIAYNLLKAGIISRSTYAKVSDRLDQQRVQAQEENNKGGGGADYYVVRRHRVGAGLIRVVDRMIAGGALTMTKAARVLGVKPTAVTRMTEINKAA